MKIKITNEEILFNNFFFTLTIPKNSKIEFDLNNPQKTTGLPMYLKVNSNIIRPTTSLGKFFYFIHKVIRMLSWYVTFPMATSSSVRDNSSPTVVQFAKNIEPFLNELKAKGYDVDQVIIEFKQFLNQPFPEELTPGTNKYKKDKLKLVLIVYLFFILLGSPLLFTKDETGGNIGIFILYIFFMSILCLGVYRGLAKLKK